MTLFKVVWEKFADSGKSETGIIFVDVAHRQEVEQIIMDATKHKISCLADSYDLRRDPFLLRIEGAVVGEITHTRDELRLFFDPFHCLST